MDVEYRRSMSRSLATASRRALQLAVLVPLFPAALAQTAPPASADGSNADNQILQEVTVTARYVKEPAQSVPISMSVLSGNDIESRGYHSIVDAAASIPNVMFTPSGQQAGNAVGVQIRGVGQTDFALTVQPGVGTYIDDVYQGTLFGTQYNLLDVASVEVLRGPQGTLAGRNSEGGAVEIHSIQPKGDGSGYAELGYGSYSHQLFRGAYDFSLIPDRVFLRVSGGIDKHDGYTTRLDYGCSHPGSIVPAQTASPSCVLGMEGGDDSRNVRAILRALVTETLSLTLQGNAFNDNAEPTPNKTLQIVTALGGAPTIAGLLNLTHPGLNYGSSFLTNSHYTNYDTFTVPLSGDPYSGRSYAPQNDLNSWGASGTVDWDISSKVHLTSIAAFQDYSGKFTAVNTAPYGSLNYQDIYHHQFSEELRLSGTALHDNLDWTLGGFYFTARSIDTGENLLSGLGNDFWQHEPATDHNESAFVHANYRLTNAWSFEAGVRYSQDAESYTFNRYFLVPFAIFPAGAPAVTSRRYETRSTREDYKLAVDYHLTPDAMAYAQVGTGYKAGGINPRAVSDATVTTFKPEDLTAYETGIKTEWFEHRLRFNADGFFSNYKDLQLNTTQAVPNGFQVVYENVGQVHIYGVESELTAQPTSALSFYTNVGWLHYHALDLGGAAYSVNNSGGALPGAPPPLTPNWKGGAGVQYRIRLNNSGFLALRADESYQSRIYFDNQGTRAASQGGYGLLNLAVSWESEHKDWVATVRADNALNKFYWVSMTNLVNPLGVLAAQPSEPRMFMFTVRRDFR